MSYLSPNGFAHDYFAEGLEHGYFIRDVHGDAYLIDSISIQFATVDLTNPDAVAWMQRIIQDNVVAQCGASGFMADFGEYVPFDAVFFDESVDAASYHNAYAEAWSQTVRDAINAMGGDADDAVIPWHRSAARESPRTARSFWLGIHKNARF